MDKITTMVSRIPLYECKHGYVYRIFSRNLNFGVFNTTDSGFIGIREKFGREYLFTEYHYDCGPPFGTVHPKQFLEVCPIVPISEEIRYIVDEKYLENKGVYTKAKLGDIVFVENKELFDYLKEIEKKYKKEDNLE